MKIQLFYINASLVKKKTILIIYSETNTKLIPLLAIFL